MTDGTRAKILVVDDEPRNIELLEAYLLPEGYEVLAARSGEEALRLAGGSGPDVVLLDLRMPGMSGHEVCRRLKADPRTARTPVLVITAERGLREKEEALQAGADDFVTKPVERADLLTRVQSLLKVRHLERELDRTLAYLQELDAARAMGTGAAEAEKPPSVAAPALADILVIDDEPFIRKQYADLLSGRYRVRTAANGLSGLEEAARPTDAILLDIMMPGMNGIEFLERFRHRVREVPVIILTAHPSLQYAIAALRLGAFDFLVKGARNEEVLAAVARAVERGRLVRRQQELLRELQQTMQRIVGGQVSGSPMPPS